VCLRSSLQMNVPCGAAPMCLIVLCACAALWRLGSVNGSLLARLGATLSPSLKTTPRIQQEALTALQKGRSITCWML
jgi:hypothetical protein